MTEKGNTSPDREQALAIDVNVLRVRGSTFKYLILETYILLELMRRNFFCHMRFMHSRHSSIYRAAEEWLNSFDDSDSSAEFSDDDSYSLESSLGPGYFCDMVPERDLKSHQPHAGMDLTVPHSLAILVPESDPGERQVRRRPQQSITIKKETVDKRMSGDVCYELFPPVCLSQYRSGCRGVSWNRRMKAWLAFWMDGKTRRSKTFSSKVYGFEEARLAAIDFLQGRKRESGGDVTFFSIDTSPPATPIQDSALSDGNVSSKSSGGSTTASRAVSISPANKMMSLSSVTTGVVAIMSG